MIQPFPTPDTETIDLYKTEVGLNLFTTYSCFGKSQAFGASPLVIRIAVEPG